MVHDRSFVYQPGRVPRRRRALPRPLTAKSDATSFGRKAGTTETMPTQMPTARAVTRVRSATATLCTQVVLGSVPIRPDSRLPTPSAASAP